MTPKKFPLIAGKYTEFEVWQNFSSLLAM